MTDLDIERPMILLEKVRKTYGSVQALLPTDLDVARGEFLTLVGPSGSGKSTMLNIVSGMTSPTAGRLFIDGRDVTDVPSSKRGIGMVFQNYALMPHMTVFQNIAFPLEVRSVPRTEIKRRVEEVLSIVRLPHLADRKPQALSGGQQQRVSIARCLVYNPSVILMDEPLGALDKSLREQMQLEIKLLHARSGITILYVTHDQDEALSMSDRIILMNGGAIEQIGTPTELYESPVSKFTAEFLGQSTMLSGEVTRPGFARLACGPTVRVGPAAAGAGHLLLRPERLRLLLEKDEPGDGNVVEGTLRDTLVSGGVVKHFLTLGDGSELLVQELANERRTRLAQGSRVRAVWAADAGLFLCR